MSAARDIYDHVLAGHHVSVGADIAGRQTVKVSGIGLRNRSEAYAPSDAETADIEAAIAAAISEVVLRGARISFFIDYYGRQWIELRSGRLIQRNQKLFLPAHLVEAAKAFVRAQRIKRRTVRTAAPRMPVSPQQHPRESASDFNVPR